MKILTMYGASDDLIETDGLPGCDEFNCFSDTNGVNATFAVITSNRRLTISAVYSGGWSFAIQPGDDDFEIMVPWKIDREWGADCAYSETIKIQCPDDAKLVRVDVDDEDD